MKETEWREATEPRKLIRFLLRRKSSERKLKLFACACARQVWSNLSDVRCKTAVEVTEAAIDEQVTVAEFVRARSGVRRVASKFRSGTMNAPEVFAAGAAIAVVKCYARSAVEQASGFALRALSHVDGQEMDWAPSEAASREQVGFIHDILGNPFHPVTFTPSWRTSDVMLLVQGIYDSRNFIAMPILADALQEAGCDNADLLNHLRDTSLAHVRGCWALDLALGKE